MHDRYEVRITGRLGPGLRASFAGMQCEVVTHQTVIRGRLSGHELHQLLERMDRFGITVVDLYSRPP